MKLPKEAKRIFEDKNFIGVQFSNEVNFFRVLCKRRYPSMARLIGLGVIKSLKFKGAYFDSIIWYLGRPKDRPYYSKTFLSNNSEDREWALKDAWDDLREIFKLKELKTK